MTHRHSFIGSLICTHFRECEASRSERSRSSLERQRAAVRKIERDLDAAFSGFAQANARERMRVIDEQIEIVRSSTACPCCGRLPDEYDDPIVDHLPPGPGHNPANNAVARPRDLPCAHLVPIDQGNPAACTKCGERFDVDRIAAPLRRRGARFGQAVAAHQTTARPTEALDMPTTGPASPAPYARATPNNRQVTGD